VRDDLHHLSEQETRSGVAEVVESARCQADTRQEQPPVMSNLRSVDKPAEPRLIDCFRKRGCEGGT
jgi:hypothetical protein